MGNTEHELSTGKYSAKQLVDRDDPLNLPFLIPIYQRLYTWEHQQVERLLIDLWVAYQKSKEKEYFIGAVVVSPNLVEAAIHNLELIDGQQRLTTLWLIASVLVTSDKVNDPSRTNWKKFMAVNEATPVARLDFSGREADKEALNSFIKNWNCIGDSKLSVIDRNSWLKNEAMLDAHKTISNFFNDDKYLKTALSEPQNIAANIQAFSDYIWSKATFVITRLHTNTGKNTGKNQFFETMNSRSIQLENHEILKARLLNVMNELDRAVYAKAWEVCADINGYLPKDVQQAFKYGQIELKEDTLNEGFKKEDKTKAGNDDGNQAKSIIYSPVPFTLENILKLDYKPSNSQGDPRGAKQTKEYKSVVSFPVFLLHVLRIFKSNKGLPNALNDISVDDKKLISQFESNLDFTNKINKNECKEFIECLLECRLLLDNFVIKGHVDEGSEFARWEIWSHLASKHKDHREKRDDKEWKSITMLQTMMYFSQDTTHAPWLTELLKGLREDLHNKGPVANDSDGSRFLAKLLQQDKRYVENRFPEKDLEKIVGAKGCAGLGTNVPHYWFFKLEYCLWELWFNNHVLTTNTAIDLPKPNIISSAATFRMRHVSSIEHVSPQSMNNGDITASELDRFGNLALISVGANSSYSDNDPSFKAAQFKRKLKDMIESLKMAHVFSYNSGDTIEWNDNNMDNHEAKMLAVLKAFHPEFASPTQTHKWLRVVNPIPFVSKMTQPCNRQLSG